MQSATDWVASLSPWPAEGFGLERMQALLDRLGRPERRYDVVHVVGTKGKSTAARTIAALLRAEGVEAAAYTSPHVSGWAERLETDAAGFDRAVERVRARRRGRSGRPSSRSSPARRCSTSQSGASTWRCSRRGSAGGSTRRTPLDGRVVLLTNVGLEHTAVLGETRVAIATEKLAIAGPGATVVLPDEEFAELVADHAVLFGGAREAGSRLPRTPRRRRGRRAASGAARGSRR